MAYLAFDDSGIAPVQGRSLDHRDTAPRADAIGADTDANAAERLSALEWSVVAFARNDRLASLRHPSRVATAIRTIFKQQNPMLADERLEALRRMAVLSWHHGYTVPAGELKRFLAAGFSAGQYETLLASIGVARLQGARR